MPLSRAQLQVLELALEDRRRMLEAELRRDAERARAESYRKTAGPVTDLGDEALADLIADLDNADLTRDLNELRALDAALARMANGKSSGRCAGSGLEKPSERLKADFEAQLKKVTQSTGDLLWVGFIAKADASIERSVWLYCDEAARAPGTRASGRFRERSRSCFP